MGIADLHIHTTCSDGTAHVKDVLDFVAAKRPHLDTIAITDHDTNEAALWAIEHQQDYRFNIIPGIEVSSTAGHILGLWVTSPIPTQLNLAETVAAIHEAGGFAILAHPFHLEVDVVLKNAKRYLLHPEVLLEAKVDAVEVFNAGGILRFSNPLARYLFGNQDIALIGSSDAHTLGAIGRGKTFYPGKSAEDLRTALQTACTTVEGNQWAITDYIEYLQHDIRRKAIRYSGRVNSSQLINT